MFRFTEFHYAQEDLVSIADSMAQPESSLETALQPLHSLVDAIEYYIQRARKFRCHPSPHGLTEEESTALYLYLDDWGAQSLQRILNHTLKSNDWVKIKPWIGFLQIFNTALEKLPTVEGTIWRGLPMDTVNKLSENEELVLCCTISCSFSKDIVTTCLGDQSVLCMVESLNAKDVHEYSPHPNDQEVLLRFGTHLRVKRKKINSGSSRMIVRLEEVNKMRDNEIMSNDVVMSSPVNEESSSSMMQAVVMFANGDRYHLSYANDKKQGYGVYRPVAGRKLKGEDADQRANGEGICNLQDGTCFLGTFQRGMRHGHSIIYFSDNTIQVEMRFEDQLRQIYTGMQSNRGYYKWQDANGQTAQYRVYDDKNGNRYIGNAIKGTAHGLGIRIWKETGRYEGSFQNDKKHGYGRYTFPSGSRYFGEWMNDEINGEGTFKWTSGTSYTGTFKKSERHGQGKLTFPNGRRQEGLWENNVFVS